MIAAFLDMPLSSYVMPVTAGAFLMGFSWLLGKYNYSVAWIGIFVALNFVKSKMWKQREKRLLAMRQTALHEKEVGYVLVIFYIFFYGFTYVLAFFYLSRSKCLGRSNYTFVSYD